MAHTVEFLLKHNLTAVFGERDGNKRRAVISEIWASDGIFVDPDGSRSGKSAIDESIEQLLQRFPEYVLSELGPVDAFHDIGRLAWGFGPPGAPPVVTGLDVLVAANGKIAALYTFLDRH